MAEQVESVELQKLLGGVVAEAGLEIDSAVVVQHGNETIVKVIIDTPDMSKEVDADSLAHVSRTISAKLDEADPIDSNYTLEVSTPGAERELKKPRHWQREIGRLIHVKLRNGETVTGHLVEADDEGAVLTNNGETTTIPFTDIKKARPRVEFGSKE